MRLRFNFNYINFSFYFDLLIFIIILFYFSGQTVLAFLNQNWKQVVEEFGKPIIDTIIQISFNVIKKFLSVVPRDELFV